MSRPSHRRCYRTDYISDLPDAIICHILSFIPTKSAVMTSVLSKRWKDAWVKVPALDFTEMPHSVTRGELSARQKFLFKNFVDKVLFQNGLPCLRFLRFNLNFDDDDIIQSCISGVKRRKISELHMRFRGEFCHLPLEFLSCKKLVVLKLGGFDISYSQVSFHLPNLEIIHFVYILFPGDLCLKEWILGCPVLKELFMEECRGFDETLYVESLSLKSLTINDTSRDGDSIPLSISIEAPNLRYLSLNIYQARYNVGELNLLTEANLDLWDCDACRSYADPIHYTRALIKAVSGVRTLRLRESYVLTFEDLPTFENLTHLKIVVNPDAFLMLHAAPKLKSLIFEVVELGGSFFYSHLVPSCMSCLERVEFFLIINKRPIDLVACILKAAIALKEMIIYLRTQCMSPEHEREIYQSLLSLPRSSPICQIKVVPNW